MLEARMVAIKTQGPLQDWIAPGAAWTADSSHGDLLGIIMRGSNLPPCLAWPSMLRQIKRNPK
jgi:hypothetical protein